MNGDAYLINSDGVNAKLLNILLIYYVIRYSVIKIRQNFCASIFSTIIITLTIFDYFHYLQIEAVLKVKCKALII